MSNVKFQLSLNKHPKDCPNYSLVSAKNVRVSDDFSCLQSEESIIEHNIINRHLRDNNLVLIDVIPCNKELVLFAKKDDNESIAHILRYNEDDDRIVDLYQTLNYEGGKIIGTFTYNVNNELIIAFSEYSDDGAIPLKTINLGVWNGLDTVSSESNFEDGKLALTPEIKIPIVSDFDYIPGTSYKGWYYYFIRYKINKNDYTRWFPIGYPIFVTTLELKNIFKYGLNNGTRTESPVNISNNYILNGASDYFSSKDDVCDESVLLTISDIDSNYNYFQLGFCCISKTYSKAFRTSDIDIPNEATGIYNYTMNISNCIEYTINDLILNNYNYYNVGNIINYKNRLYISNYKENNNPIISEEELNKISIYLSPKLVSYSDIKYKDLASNIESDIDESSDDFIPANPILNIDNTDIALQLDGTVRSTNKPYAIDLNGCYITTNNGIKIYGIPKYKETIQVNQYQWKLNFDINFIINSANNIINISITPNDISDTWTPATTYSFFAINTVASSFNTTIPIKKLFSYINTNNSFKERKINSTLIPGEIYSFYIHFINKYGESTPGYKLSNNVKFKVEDQGNKEYFPIALNSEAYLLAELNSSIFNSNGEVNESGLLIKTSLRSISDNDYVFFGDSLDVTVDNALKSIGLKAALPGITPDVEPYPPTIKWYEIFSTKLLLNRHPFYYYINNNGDKLFKVPDTSFSFNENSNTIQATIWQFGFNLNNFSIPDGYIGYYFSYEKFESQNKITGVLSKFDIFEQEDIADKYKKYNNESNQNIINANFYSDRLDIDDNLNLNYDFIKQELGFQIESDSSSDTYTVDKIDILSGKYPINYNKVETPLNTTKYIPIRFRCTPINDIQLNKGGNISNGKFGLGTSLSIKLSTNQVKTLFLTSNYIRVSLFKINKNIYTNENKILIKFTNVFYIDDTKTQIISKGLNGHITYQGTLIYNYNKFIMSAENIILTEQYRPYYRCPVYKGLYDKWIGENRPPVAYLQQICYSDIFYEAKSFKNEPETLFQNLEEIKADTEEQVMPFAANSIVTPANSIDLFQELQTNQDKLNPKTYLANSNSRSYVTQFDKRVQRSNVIADESLVNSWRTFPLEGYRDISENKGKITNLIGIGTTLLVHTEHSLFAFDGSNTLKTGDDQDIKLTLPDIFDIDYTEVFTSDLGVCGLQDKEAWVVGQFGYIFYDNDAHRFYKFSSKKVEFIDFDIVQFLNYAVPYEVRFAHDIERNRILIHFAVYDGIYISRPIINHYTLSYNHQLNKFISLHTYDFVKAANTKNILYLINDDYIYCNAHDFYSSSHNVQRRRYNSSIDNYAHYDNGTTQSPSISVIVNDSYSLMKTIEFLTYKLFKRIDSTLDKRVTDIIGEREFSKVPYSGFKLRIHNDLCDSGEIDVSVDDESVKNLLANYNKPWWEFGNWNFNYFRDIKQGTSSHDIMSRIYGNYFVIDIIFYDDENPYPQKIEFENLDVKLITDETV